MWSLNLRQEALKKERSESTIDEEKIRGAGIVQLLITNSTIRRFHCFNSLKHLDKYIYYNKCDSLSFKYSIVKI